MSFVTWTDDDIPRTVRFYTSGNSNGVCVWTEPAYRIGWTFNHQLRSVTSWRGKREEIRVGSKRRQVFRPFLVQRRESSHPYGHFLWCPAPGKVMRAVGMQQHRMSLIKYWSDNGLNPTYWAGSSLPPYFYSEIAAIGKDYRDRMILDLFAKAKEPRYDSAVFLAELGETLVSIKGLFLGAVKAFTKARNAWHTVKHLTLSSEELWLWYRYFLLPAMLDAEELIAAIKPQAVIDRIQTGCPKQKISTRGHLQSNLWWDDDGSYSFKIPWTCEQTIGAGCAMDITKRLDPSQWGTSAVDVMRAGWEIIPFSFVADWFVSLGDFLTTLRDVELEIAQSYATFAIEQVVKFGVGSDMYTDVNPYIKWTIIERVINLEPPALPMVNNSYFNVLRTIDSIALAAGMIKSILSRGKRR